MPDLDEPFRGPALATDRWLPYYLPQWSSREAAAARFSFLPGGGGLELRIDADQAPWCPEWDGGVRVSSLQTGVFAGPLGSDVGQHRFHPDARVREEQPSARLYTPTYGRIAVRLRAPADPHAMVALWMIGFEDAHERSGEICVCEIFGRDVDPTTGYGRVGMGVHPFGDPQLRDDFAQVRVERDLRLPHDYAADWSPDGVVFSVDGVEVRRVAQAPDYPMQLMLGLYAFPDADGGSGELPKRAVVEWVRGEAPRGVTRSA